MNAEGAKQLVGFSIGMEKPQLPFSLAHQTAKLAGNEKGDLEAPHLDG